MAPVESPQMISTVKLPMLKKGEYTLWSMRMEQYLTNTDYGLWQIIMNGDEPVQTTKDENGVETEVPPKTAQAILARQKERKAKSILLLAIPDEYQLRFHTIKDAKSLWAAIKKGLDKAYDRFQKLISQLEVHGAAVPNEDANQKILRALPSSWNNVPLDLLQTLIMWLFHSQKTLAASSGPQLDDEDLEQIDHDGLEEIDLKWECRATRNQGNKNGDAGYKSRDNTRRTVPVETSDALVVQDNALIVQDGLGYDWSYIAQDEPTEFALMAYTSNSSGSDTEVQSCSKNCVKTYEKLQKQFDEQRQTLSKANLEIVAYQLGLESVEAQLIVHQKNEAVYEEKIAVLEFEVKDKGNAVTRLTNQLEQTLKEKEDLKAKLEQFETSSKNLNKLINSQISSKDKTGLGYGDQLNENDSSGSELFNSVFDSRSSDGDDNQTNDRFKKDNEYHAVPPPLTGNYMPPLADLSFAGLDDSVYRPTTNKTSASVSQVETSNTPPSNTSVEMPRVEYVRPSEVIIEDWVSDDEEDIFLSKDSQTTGNPQQALKYKGMFDSGCSRHMTGNKALLTDYQDIEESCCLCGSLEVVRRTGNQTNKNAGPQETNGNTGLKKNVDAGQTKEENVSTQQYIVFPLWSSISSSYKSSDDKAKDYTVDDDACRKTYKTLREYDQAFENEKITRASSTNSFNTVSTPVNTASASRTFSPVGPSSGPSFDTAEIQSTGIFSNAYDDHDLETLNTPYVDQSVGAEADFNNMESSTVVSPIPTTRVHSIHPKAQIIWGFKVTVQIQGHDKEEIQRACYE
ncbi:hypothetical protein Tco_1113679 [Tanacetum coccineum]|uniref:Uncharacterized protein n=1 Tax=Tanacetum coccineum TaxID=301880 RepID=A0ABQ5ISU9_9ASTR